MMMHGNRQFEEARILETSRQLDQRDPDQIAMRMREKFLTIAASEEGAIKQWFVLRVARRSEIDVANLLVTYGIETWLPVKKIKKVVKFTRRIRVVEEPVFNGYLFVKVVPCAESFVGLSRIQGAYSLICGRNGALVISDQYINDLKKLIDVGVFDEAKAMPRYKNGERVEFPIGHAGVFEGVIDGYVGTRAVRVLAHIFGQERTIEVPLANLTKPD